ncbi:MAG TPA: addiction module protein [Methylomirabilota bacterium]|nr:addiction module protein [Methylomirabilota bacterium]
MSEIEISALLNLPLAERLRLVEALWDSIAEHPDALPLTDAERVELDRRWAEYVQDPTGGSSWADVKARITSR